MVHKVNKFKKSRRKIKASLKEIKVGFFEFIVYCRDW